MSLSHFIASYGYWAVFALVTVESLGIPLPSETTLIIAAAYAGHTHHLSPWIIFAVALAGAVTGDNIGFWIGHKGGYRLARRYGPKVRLDERKLKIAHYLFDTHGVKVVFFGRFISVLRTYAALLAGASRMRWRRFLPANVTGAITWAGACTLAGYLAGGTLQNLSGTIELIIGATAGLIIAAALLTLRRQAGSPGGPKPPTPARSVDGAGSRVGRRRPLAASQPGGRSAAQSVAPPGVITAAALVMVCVFALFGTLASLDLKQVGSGWSAQSRNV